ncbi:energy transducer TonB [Maricaulis sp.]|uniref:energy transducer TonB n=1 Tax=Maricaulis sp. TaxID=1486257 RepID=UPI001AFD158E|nr:energy transducer TonB [Maricaulis sp.]MBO6796030.1 energy transducer TonB [Maricaulis sp.]
MRLISLIMVCVLASCAGIPQLRQDSQQGPFRPRDIYPTTPNVERLIGPEDCRGSTLAAVQAELPSYPGRAYQNGRQGWVVVRFDVNTDGSVARTRIARSVPDGVFDRASRRAVSSWVFRPLEGAQTLENCVVMFEFRAGEVRIR